VKIVKIIVLLIAAVFAGMQFFRPQKNLSNAGQPMDISTVVEVPADVAGILRESCYDCHSNNTRYPWYAEVMPAGWFLDGHVTDGKEHLNFSEFANGNLRRQYHKLEEISEMVGEGEMPLQSYLLLHRGAALSEAQKETLHRWVDASRASMKARYPADSLERRRN
jgi:hypothetical protein